MRLPGCKKVNVKQPHLFMYKRNHHIDKCRVKKKKTTFRFNGRNFITPSTNSSVIAFYNIKKILRSITGKCTGTFIGDFIHGQ